MEFFTYHDFMLNAKNAVYILMGVIVLGFVGLWSFILARDTDHEKSGHDGHH
ncbi:MULTISPECIES: sulfate respiration complex protein HmcD [Desulfovibrio]|jgi:hypothetical protein|uniref:sulfate respiration complex protein HmcD n=1 Tax=Desulfovibrio TaxID=872 RepID=UPI0004031342|nr:MULTISPECIES: hypothetical protein [Desulfovibrio]MDY0306003.1 hypothetical protein [Desulfovibrionaceae bacterium]HMM39897.1 hypothetical protein [Desulfovibrio sp.]